MTINIIAAVAQNRAIGNENKLLYWLPNDLKRFKALTTGHTILMGRKTYDSLPKGALPNRRNVVISRTVAELPGCEVYASLGEALKHCATDEEVYVIGGASVYEQALPIADRLCLTEIADTPAEADAFFPDYAEWHEVNREEHDTDEKHEYKYAFVDYERSVGERRITPRFVTSLRPEEVFVFGSNLDGFHGGGAARMAHEKFGAVWGQGVGLQGQTYAIPTMQGGVETIKPYVDEFIAFAKHHPEKHFLVTLIGCGIAGFAPEEIAPLFAQAREVKNVWLPEEFWK